MGSSEARGSIQPLGTIFVALHGELVSHPWRRPGVDSSDAYSLFVARSSAMGWLPEPRSPFSGGVWGMNDAGQGPGSGQRTSRVAWFQVSLTGPVPVGRPLAVQAFLSCAGDVLARLGTPRLEAVQVLLPVQSLTPSTTLSSRVSAVMTLLQDAGWFADSDPDRRTPVRITLHGGQHSAIRSAAPGMFGFLTDYLQNVFTGDSFSLTGDNDADLGPAVTDELWHGPARHRATFHGTLTEWSLDAVGWVAAFLAEAAAQHHITTPLMLTARTIRQDA